MKTVSIHEAKTHLSRLIQQALDGEEIVIANRSEPMVRLEVVRKELPARRFGGLAGERAGRAGVVVHIREGESMPVDGSGDPKLSHLRRMGVGSDLRC